MRSHASTARRRLLGTAVSLLLFAGALYVLHAELRDHPLGEILAELRSFSPLRLILSLAATVLGFLALAGYDAVSLPRWAGRLPFRRVAFAAFLG
jgi:hypothetical protein